MYMYRPLTKSSAHELQLHNKACLAEVENNVIQISMDKQMAEEKTKTTEKNDEFE